MARTEVDMAALMRSPFGSLLVPPKRSKPKDDDDDDDDNKKNIQILHHLINLQKQAQAPSVQQAVNTNSNTALLTGLLTHMANKAEDSGGMKTTDRQIIGFSEMLSAAMPEAFRDLQEGLRPNQFAGLIAATNPVTSGTTQTCTQITIPAESEIVAFVAEALDSSFTWSSFKPDGTELVKAGSVNNSVFHPGGLMERALLPYAGRIFENNLTFDGTVVNQDAATKYHHGLAILYIDRRCMTTYSKLKLRPRYATMDRVRERLMNFIGAVAPQAKALMPSSLFG